VIVHYEYLIQYDHLFFIKKRKRNGKKILLEFLPVKVDLFDERSRRNFDFSFRSFGVLSFILSEPFFHIITIIIIYDTVITINGIR